MKADDVIIVWVTQDQGYIWSLAGDRKTFNAGQTWEEWDGALPPIALRSEVDELKGRIAEFEAGKRE